MIDRRVAVQLSPQCASCCYCEVYHDPKVQLLHTELVSLPQVSHGSRGSSAYRPNRDWTGGHRESDPVRRWRFVPELGSLSGGSHGHSSHLLLLALVRHVW